MTRKTPQEKKRDSYQRDRRNTYGESGARSRFAITRAKRKRARRARAAAREAVNALQRDPELGERLVGRAVVRFGGRWRKVPDDPLGEVLEDKLSRRARSGALPEPVLEDKVSRFLQATDRRA